MKMTFACPMCGMHKTCRGDPGERKILVCKNCFTKGFVSFPKNVVDKKFLSKKQIVAVSVIFVVFVCFVFLVFMPTMQGDLHFLTVRSGSMEPGINTGDIVVVSSVVDVGDVRVGDVITFRYSNDSDPDRFITHRVVDVVRGEYDTSFKTKGDANEEEDRRVVSSSEFVGKTVLVIPYLGYFSDFARGKIGYILFLLLPAFLIIVFEALRIYRIRKREIL